MRREIKVLELDRYEHGILVNALNGFRNDLKKADTTTEDVDRLILKMFNLPIMKKKSFNRKLVLEVR